MQRLAALALAAAAGILVYFGQYGRAVVVAGVAAAILLLLPARTVPQATAEALHAATMADATEALRLEGRGLLVPTAHGIQLFVPAQDTSTPPSFDGTRLAQRPPVGLWLTPPGTALFEAWPRPKAGIEGATVALKQALPALGLGDRVVVEKGPRIRITYRPRIRFQDDAARAWHLQGADPVTSFIGMVLAHALQRPVRLVARHETGQGLRSEWEP